MMDNFNRDLDLLENLSKKISDLIYNNDFSQIPFIEFIMIFRQVL